MASNRIVEGVYRISLYKFIAQNNIDLLLAVSELSPASKGRVQAAGGPGGMGLGGCFFHEYEQRFGHESLTFKKVYDMFTEAGLSDVMALWRADLVAKGKPVDGYLPA